MQTFLLSFPLWVLFTVLVVGSGVLAACASLWVARYAPRKTAGNDVGLAIFQVVGSVFGIVLAFTISAVYAEFEAAASNVSQESNDIASLYRLALELPEPNRSSLQDGLRNYVHLTVREEWDLMARGGASPKVSGALDHLWYVQREVQPGGAKQHALDRRLYERVQSLTDRRRDRLRDSRAQLATVMWGMLIGGGVITVLFSLFIRSGDDRSQAAMSSIMAAMIGFGLLLVMALDSPFTGSVRVSADAISATLEVFQRLQGP